LEQATHNATGNILELHGVAKRFNGVAAVQDISLEIVPGEFLSLLGPSGCGKTTTLRLIAGFEHPDEGSVLLKGEGIAAYPPNKRDVNTVFQHYALFPHLTVGQNIGYGLKIRRLQASEIERRVNEVLETVQMAGLEQRYPHQLSGGQQQRIALARALVNRPSVLLLDEPLGALDLQVRKRMQIELKKIQRDIGITFIYVTHDQEEALTLSDRIVVMNKARIEQIGSPREIYSAPRTPFVLNFVGSANWFTGSASIDSQGMASVNVAPDIVMKAPFAGRLAASQGGIGIRQENISVSDSPQAANSFQGTVIESVFQGTHLLTEVALAPGISVTLLNALNAGSLARGATVWVSWAPEDARFYPL
jgi:spermidine/putrescine transport system ATP-binding protein